MTKRVSNSRTNRFRKGVKRARQQLRWGWRKRRVMAYQALINQQRRLAAMTKGEQL